MINLLRVVCVMWLLIFRIFLLLVAAFCCVIAFILGYALVTNKKYREKAWEDLKRRARERERERNRPYESEYYKRTGCRNFLSRGNRKY